MNIVRLTIMSRCCCDVYRYRRFVFGCPTCECTWDDNIGMGILVGLENSHTLEIEGYIFSIGDHRECVSSECSADPITILAKSVDGITMYIDIIGLTAHCGDDELHCLCEIANYLVRESRVMRRPHILRLLASNMIPEIADLVFKYL
jgi:hypothetical protein